MLFEGSSRLVISIFLLRIWLDLINIDIVLVGGFLQVARKFSDQI